jgi:hypothetical protein
MSTFASSRPLHIPTPAERTFKALKEAHWQQMADAATEADLPAWWLHLASGTEIRVRWIGKHGPLMKFTGFDGTQILVAPEAVQLSMCPPPPDAPGVKIGFTLPEAQDVDLDDDEPVERD